MGIRDATQDDFGQLRQEISRLKTYLLATLDGEQQQGSDAVDPIVLVPLTATGGAVDNLTKALLVHVFKYNFPGTYLHSPLLSKNS